MDDAIVFIRKSTMTSKSLQDPVERLKKLGESLRNRGGINYNTAKLEQRHETIRVEFFRGKDFERYFAAHPEILDGYADKSRMRYLLVHDESPRAMPIGGSKSVADKTADLGNRFLKNGLVSKAQRKYKKPKPGKKRLVKWPRTLLHLNSKVAS